MDLTQQKVKEMKARGRASLSKTEWNSACADQIGDGVAESSLLRRRRHRTERFEVACKGKRRTAEQSELVGNAAWTSGTAEGVERGAVA